MTTQDLQRRTVKLPDGRELDVQVAGPDTGPALVFHHGTPGSSFAPPRLVEAVTGRGLRLVAPSRAGYAGSSRDEGRDVVAVASDTGALLDALGVERFATAGWSGGGPHALACAAALPDRCVAALSISGVAPYLPEVFDWTAGMAEDNVREFQLSIEAGEEYEELLSGFRDYFLALQPEDVSSIRDLLGDLVSVQDVAAASAEETGYLLANVSLALASGTGGWRDDDQAFLRPWGFELEQIEVPVGIWYGEEDLMVPPTHGAWLASHVPGAKVTRLPLEGHLSFFVERLDDLLDELVALGGATW